MKMFIWDEVNCDYTCGMVVVVAENIYKAFDELKKALERKEPDICEDTIEECLNMKPEIRDIPNCVGIYGGG